MVRGAARWLAGAWIGLVACEGTEIPAASDGDSAGEEGTCTAQVVIGFFSDPACSEAVSGPASSRTYDTSMACFSWSGSSSAGENSVTNMQCYRDRLCYTQHPASLVCASQPTDKEARTDRCVLDTAGPEGSIYALILSGTASCPEAPEGFECPASESGAGTAGIAECTTEG